MDHTDLKSIIESLNIEYNAVFVPFSLSRNAKEVKIVSDYSINWKITLKRNNVTLKTDYSQGIGYLPKALQYSVLGRISVDKFNAIKETCETGRTRLRNPLKKPDLMDVLCCLVMDSDVLNCGSFEEWANNYGWDTDSRSVLKIYEDCLRDALLLRAMFGNDTLEMLADLYSEY